MSTAIEVTGPARLDRLTKNLTKRLERGDIAIVHHRDLDRVSAEELVAAGARVVVNCSPSRTGRFPNPGPLVLVRGGVKLIDIDEDLFEHVKEGEVLSVRGGGVFRDGTLLGSGRVLTENDLARDLAEQQSRVTEALEQFADNTMR